MARVLAIRAVAWLAVAMLCGWTVLSGPRAAMAQGVVAGPPPGSQPMWMTQPGTLQVGPNGAVNLDQRMMTPYGAQPVMVMSSGPSMYPAGEDCSAPPPSYVQPCPPCPAPTPTQWVVPAPAPAPAPPPIPLGPVPQVAQVAVPATVPFFVHRTGVFGEVLYLRPRDAEVAYALPIDGPVAPVLGNEVPVGPVEVVDPDYDLGFRLGANVALDGCNSIRGQYTWYNNQAQDSATVVAPQVLRSLVTLPLGANVATDSLDASANLEYEFQQIDLDYRGLIGGQECDPAYAVNFIAGVEFARLDQRFNSQFVTLTTTAVDTNVEFEGVGMRIGLEGERFFPASCFFVYGNWINTFLFGEFDASYVQTDSIAGIEGTTAFNAGRIVPVTEFELGAGWLGANRHLRLSAGYRVSAWFNTITTDGWINAAQSSDFTDMDDTLTFDGIVGRAEWLF